MAPKTLPATPRKTIVYVLLLLLVTGIASAQNILTNAGFELGLMCYLTNVWSYSGNFGAGDYRLSLSGDSHSGQYSLEINCNGGNQTDCFKAAAISSPIPTAPSQNYILNVYSKCVAGEEAAVFIPSTANGDLYAPVNCTGNWAPNSIPFQTGPAAQDFFYYLFSFNGGWVRYDDIVLTYGDGSAPAGGFLHPGVRNVSVSNQNLLVDGSPYLALGFFDVPYSDLAQVKATGANTIFGLGITGTPAACYNTTQIGFQDRAYELGLAFVPDSSTTARLGIPSVVQAAMDKYAPHLANISWMLTDEPDQSLVPFWYIDPSVFGAEYTAAKTHTTLPVFADFQRAAWSVSSDVAPFAPSVDFFMAEPYGPDFQFPAHAADMFHSFSPSRPIWMAQDNPDASLIVPKAYWLIVNGVTGIGYFTWSAFKGDPVKLAAVEQAFSELTQLKSAIFGQNLSTLVTPPSGIGATARYSGNGAYIMAVNPVAQNIPNGFFPLAGLLAGQKVQVLFENRTITATAGGFTDSFSGVSRHVYYVQAPIASIAGTVLQKTGPDNARDWQVKVQSSGLTDATGVSITKAVFAQTGGTACSPSVISTLPLSLGNIPTGSSANGDLMLNFSGCDTSSKFTVTIGLASNGGSAIASIVRNNDRK